MGPPGQPATPIAASGKQPLRKRIAIKIARHGPHYLLLAVLALYLMLVAIGSGYVFIQLWSAQVSSTGPVTSPVNSTVHFWPTSLSFNVTSETRIVGLVLTAGAIGAVTYGLYAEFIHIARKDFDPAWSLWYLARPFIGAFFGLIFYLALRAGLFSIGSPATELNLFGFSALAALVGMFQEETLAKFRQVAESVLTKSSPPLAAEYATGEDIPKDGIYEFREHTLGATCSQAHQGVLKLRKGGIFPNASPCNQPGIWRLVRPTKP